MSTEFKLPELGENIEKGDVVRVLVAPGDEVAKDQTVLELETDKATIEVPSGVAGTVSAVPIKEGDSIAVGQVVLVVDSSIAAASAANPAPAAPPALPAEAPVAARSENVVDIAAARQPARAEAAPAPAVAEASLPAATVRAGKPIPASPSVRRFARELGVDIAGVAGTGPGGRIGHEDVKQHVKTQMTGGAGLIAGRAAPALPDFTKWGGVDVQPMSNIRRKTAEHLSAAWQAPHVTQNDKADVTAFEQFRAAFGKRVERAGGKLTVTAVVIKLVAAAIDRYPQFASSVDMPNESVIVKSYRHVGVAVDTPKGLLVPVIRDVDRKTVTEIALELAALSQKARDRKLSLDEMSGGVFSVTNLGGIGGTSFSPIVNQPEVAILGLSRTATEPVWRDGQFVPRQMLPLSLSYDHRVIDGADAARFLRFLVDALEQPLSMYL